ncbi:hypothetical protein HWV62_42556 [Athelia sp. TMB]|nr:hypothetical protein HWV62_42556 [Athelia sp. TMB]
MAHPGDKMRDMLAVFTQMQRIAEPILEKIGRPSLLPSSSTAPLQFSIILPIPTPILPDLLDIGLAAHISSAISEDYLKRAAQLQATVEESFTRVCNQLAALPSKNASMPFEYVQKSLAAAQQKAYARVLEEWRNAAITKARSSVIQLDSNARPARQPFNHDYVPLLEHYFAENPLPTHADKKFLADKCGMTFRQIHVWNRRNRTRKEGQPFKRKPQYEPLRLPLDDLFSKMPHSIIPEEKRQKYVDSDASEYEWQYESSDEDVAPTKRFRQSGWLERHPREPGADDILDAPRPIHAFPGPYPAPQPYQPFPAGWKPSFAAPAWERRASKAPSKRAETIEMSELTALFERMPTKDCVRKYWRKKTPRDPLKPMKPARTSSPAPKPDRSAATAYITVKPPVSTHPALVHPITPRQFLVPKPARIMTPEPASPSRKRSYASSDASSSGHDSDVDQERAPRKRRKVAGLPKRVPTGTSLAHRAFGEVPSATLVPHLSPSTPVSRTRRTRSPSSERDSPNSKRARTASDSSSSELATPESCTQPLPVYIHAPNLSMAGFSTRSHSGMSELFSDSPANPSLVDGSQDEYLADSFPRKQPRPDYTRSSFTAQLHSH